MSNKTENIVEEVKGRTKEAIGELIDDDDLKREGEAQRKKVEERRKADQLEEMAEERRQKAAGHKGEEHARRKAS
ncbi:MAG: hypothetical protein R3249_02435 [Nitriliruptorales bacterium]|nr:hypothetical protein [Nitriliruptorales bacterium]